MISVLLPSRGRPENIKRLWESIQETADHPDDIEMVVVVDSDDPTIDQYVDYAEGKKNLLLLTTKRKVLSQYWNQAYGYGRGPIYMHCGDDIIFRDTGWDTKVLAAFNEFDDKIVFVHGNDGGGNGANFGTHGFLHKNWIDVVGYFVPPYFSSDYNDTWLNDVSNMIERRRYVDVLTEHMHPAFNKGPWDITHQERLRRHKSDNVDELYYSKYDERRSDAEKLKVFIKQYSDVSVNN